MKKKMTRKNLPKKVLKNVMKKSSETPMNKGRKPNKTQERKREEKKNITSVVNNSSNISKKKSAAVVGYAGFRTLNAVYGRGYSYDVRLLVSVLPKASLCSAHVLLLPIPRVSCRFPTSCGNKPAGCGNKPAGCGNNTAGCGGVRQGLLLQGFFQPDNRFFRIFLFFEQRDKFAAYDSS